MDLADEERFNFEVVLQFVFSELDIVASQHVWPLLRDARDPDLHQIPDSGFGGHFDVLNVVLAHVYFGLEFLEPEQVVVLLFVAFVDELEEEFEVFLFLQDCFQFVEFDFHVFHNDLVSSEGFG